jgi:polyphosphate kinase 2 (PPK2 family)
MPKKLKTQSKQELSSPHEKLKGKEYQRQLARLHVKLVELQEWVKSTGAKICIVFEGRDGAGKGGTIKAITEAHSDDKRRARLNIITHLLGKIPYKKVPGPKVKLPKRQKKDGYQEPDYPYKMIPEMY